jgi:hypothetical protein
MQRQGRFGINMTIRFTGETVMVIYNNQRKFCLWPPMALLVVVLLSLAVAQVLLIRIPGVL